MKISMIVFCISLAISMMFPIQGFSKKIKSLPCKPREVLEGFVSPDQINDVIRKMVGKYKGGGGDENVAPGCRPGSQNGGKIRRDALHFAILYSKYPAWTSKYITVC